MLFKEKLLIWQYKKSDETPIQTKFWFSIMSSQEKKILQQGAKECPKKKFQPQTPSIPNFLNIQNKKDK